MKGKSVMFLLELCVILITCLGKLMFLITCVDIKQNLGHVWLLGPYTLGKLIFLITCVDIK